MIKSYKKMGTQNNELEVMRQQLAILNKKLEGQQIISDKMMRMAMSSKMSWIKKFVWTEVVILPACILFLFYIASELHISYAPMVFFAFFAVIDITLDYRINILNGKAFLQDNIKDIVSKLIVMKKHRFMQFIAGFLMGTFFILWLFYEFYKQQVSNGEDFSVGLMFGTIGFIIGSILAIFVYCKMQHTNDAIIKQIQELNKE